MADPTSNKLTPLSWPKYDPTPAVPDGGVEPIVPVAPVEATPVADIKTDVDPVKPVSFEGDDGGQISNVAQQQLFRHKDGFEPLFGEQVGSKAQSTPEELSAYSVELAGLYEDEGQGVPALREEWDLVDPGGYLRGSDGKPIWQYVEIEKDPNTGIPRLVGQALVSQFSNPLYHKHLARQNRFVVMRNLSSGEEGAERVSTIQKVMYPNLSNSEDYSAGQSSSSFANLPKDRRQLYEDATSEVALAIGKAYDEHKDVNTALREWKNFHKAPYEHSDIAHRLTQEYDWGANEGGLFMRPRVASKDSFQRAVSLDNNSREAIRAGYPGWGGVIDFDKSEFASSFMDAVYSVESNKNSLVEISLNGAPLSDYWEDKLGGRYETARWGEPGSPMHAWKGALETARTFKVQIAVEGKDHIVFRGGDRENAKRSLPAVGGSAREGSLAWWVFRKLKRLEPGSVTFLNEEPIGDKGLTTMHGDVTYNSPVDDAVLNQAIDEAYQSFFRRADRAWKGQSHLGKAPRDKHVLSLLESEAFPSIVAALTPGFSNDGNLLNSDIVRNLTGLKGATGRRLNQETSVQIPLSGGNNLTITGKVKDLLAFKRELEPLQKPLGEMRKRYNALVENSPAEVPEILHTQPAFIPTGALNESLTGSAERSRLQAEKKDIALEMVAIISNKRDWEESFFGSKSVFFKEIFSLSTYKQKDDRPFTDKEKKRLEELSRRGEAVSYLLGEIEDTTEASDIVKAQTSAWSQAAAGSVGGLITPGVLPSSMRDAVEAAAKELYGEPTIPISAPEVDLGFEILRSGGALDRFGNPDLPSALDVTIDLGRGPKYSTNIPRVDPTDQASIREWFALINKESHDPTSDVFRHFSKWTDYDFVSPDEYLEQAGPNRFVQAFHTLGWGLDIVRREAQLGAYLGLRAYGAAMLSAPERARGRIEAFDEVFAGFDFEGDHAAEAKAKDVARKFYDITHGVEPFSEGHFGYAFGQNADWIGFEVPEEGGRSMFNPSFKYFFDYAVSPQEAHALKKYEPKDASWQWDVMTSPVGKEIMEMTSWFLFDPLLWGGVGGSARLLKVGDEILVADKSFNKMAKELAILSQRGGVTSISGEAAWAQRLAEMQLDIRKLQTVADEAERAALLASVKKTTELIHDTFIGAGKKSVSFRQAGEDLVRAADDIKSSGAINPGSTAGKLAEDARLTVEAVERSLERIGPLAKPVIETLTEVERAAHASEVRKLTQKLSDAKAELAVFDDTAGAEKFMRRQGRRLIRDANKLEHTARAADHNVRLLRGGRSLDGKLLEGTRISDVRKSTGLKPTGRLPVHMPGSSKVRYIVPAEVVAGSPSIALKPKSTGKYAASRSAGTELKKHRAGVDAGLQAKRLAKVEAWREAQAATTRGEGLSWLRAPVDSYKSLEMLLGSELIQFDQLTTAEKFLFVGAKSGSAALLWPTVAYDWIAKAFGTTSMQPFLNVHKDGLLRRVPQQLWDQYIDSLHGYMRKHGFMESELLQHVNRITANAADTAKRHKAAAPEAIKNLRKEILKEEVKKKAALSSEEKAGRELVIHFLEESIARNERYLTPGYNAKAVLAEAANEIETGAGLIKRRPELAPIVAEIEALVQKYKKGVEVEEDALRQILVLMQRELKATPEFISELESQMSLARNLIDHPEVVAHERILSLRAAYGSAARGRASFRNVVRGLSPEKLAATLEELRVELLGITMEESQLGWIRTALHEAFDGNSAAVRAFENSLNAAMGSNDILFSMRKLATYMQDTQWGKKWSAKSKEITASAVKDAAIRLDYEAASIEAFLYGELEEFFIGEHRVSAGSSLPDLEYVSKLLAEEHLISAQAIVGVEKWKTFEDWLISGAAEAPEGLERAFALARGEVERFHMMSNLVPSEVSRTASVMRGATESAEAIAIKEKLRSVSKGLNISDEEVEAILAVHFGRSLAWALETGNAPSDWWAHTFADIKRARGRMSADTLYQIDERMGPVFYSQLARYVDENWPTKKTGSGRPSTRVKTDKVLTSAQVRELITSKRAAHSSVKKAELAENGLLGILEGAPAERWTKQQFLEAIETENASVSVEARSTRLESHEIDPAAAARIDKEELFRRELVDEQVKKLTEQWTLEEMMPAGTTMDEMEKFVLSAEDALQNRSAIVSDLLALEGERSFTDITATIGAWARDAIFESSYGRAIDDFEFTGFANSVRNFIDEQTIPTYRDERVLGVLQGRYPGERTESIARHLELILTDPPVLPGQVVHTAGGAKYSSLTSVHRNTPNWSHWSLTLPGSTHEIELLVTADYPVKSLRVVQPDDADFLSFSMKFGHVYNNSHYKNTSGMGLISHVRASVREGFIGTPPTPLASSKRALSFHEILPVLPGGPLPRHTYQAASNRNMNTGGVFIFIKDKQVGGLKLEHKPIPKIEGLPVEGVRNVLIDYNLRGKGLGKWLYEEAIKNLRSKHPGGFVFSPALTSSRNSASQRVWKSLAKKYPSDPNGMIYIGPKENMPSMFSRPASLAPTTPGYDLLHVGELQSDIHKAGGKGGYGTRSLPDAPFKTNWVDLSIKAAVREAVEMGKDGISFDTGRTNLYRYHPGRESRQTSLKFYSPENAAGFKVFDSALDSADDWSSLQTTELEKLIGKPAYVKHVLGVGADIPYRRGLDLNSLEADPKLHQLVLRNVRYEGAKIGRLFEEAFTDARAPAAGLTGLKEEIAWRIKRANKSFTEPAGMGSINTGIYKDALKKIRELSEEKVVFEPRQAPPSFVPFDTTRTNMFSPVPDHRSGGAGPMFHGGAELAELLERTPRSDWPEHIRQFIEDRWVLEASSAKRVREIPPSVFERTYGYQGGLGHIVHYDTVVPSRIKKLYKKHGMKLEDGYTHIPAGEDLAVRKAYLKNGGSEEEYRRIIDTVALELGKDAYGMHQGTDVGVRIMLFTEEFKKLVLKEGEPLYQIGNEVKKGAVKFVEDGRAILYLYKNADASTLIHEMGHILRRQLPDAQLRAAERFAGVKDGKWTRAAEETFARAFERFVYDHIAPTGASDELVKAFSLLKTSMRSVYEELRSSDIDIQMPPQIQNLFAGMTYGRSVNSRLASKLAEKALTGRKGAGAKVGAATGIFTKETAAYNRLRGAVHGAQTEAEAIDRVRKSMWRLYGGRENQKGLSRWIDRFSKRTGQILFETESGNSPSAMLGELRAAKRMVTEATAKADASAIKSLPGAEERVLAKVAKQSMDAPARLDILEVEHAEAFELRLPDKTARGGEYVRQLRDWEIQLWKDFNTLTKNLTVEDKLIASFSALKDSPGTTEHMRKLWSVMEKDLELSPGVAKDWALGPRLQAENSRIAPVVEELRDLIKKYERLYEESGMDFMANPTIMLQKWGVVDYFPHSFVDGGSILSTAGSQRAGGAIETHRRMKSFMGRSPVSLDERLTVSMDAQRRRGIMGTIREINMQIESKGEFGVDPLQIVRRYMQANGKITAREFLFALLDTGVIQPILPILREDGTVIPASKVARQRGYIPLLARESDEIESISREHILFGTRKQWAELDLTEPSKLEALLGFDLVSIKVGKESALRRKGSFYKSNRFATWATEVGEIKAISRIEDTIGAIRYYEMKSGADKLTNVRDLVRSALELTDEAAQNAALDSIAASLRDRVMKYANQDIRFKGKDLRMYFAGGQEGWKLYIPESVVASMENILAGQLGESGAFKGALDNIQNFYKVRLTVLAIAFHARNAVSNVVQSFLNLDVPTVLDPKSNMISGVLAVGVSHYEEFGSMVKARKALAAPRLHGETTLAYNSRQTRSKLFETQYGRMIDDGVDLGDGVIRSLDDSYDILKRHGVLSESFTQYVDIADVEANLLDMMARNGLGGTWTKAKQGLSVTEDALVVMLPMAITGGLPVTLPKGLGASLGRTIENQARVLNFRGALSQGASLADSAKRVEKHLFNYGDLTSVQKQYMRTIFPFFVWSNKNVWLQLESIGKVPSFYSSFNHLMYEGLPNIANAALEDEETGLRPVNPNRQSMLAKREPHSYHRISLPVPGMSNVFMEGFGLPQEGFNEWLNPFFDSARFLRHGVIGHLNGADYKTRYWNHSGRQPLLRVVGQGNIPIRVLAELGSGRHFFYDKPISELTNGRMIADMTRGIADRFGGPGELAADYINQMMGLSMAWRVNEEGTAYDDIPVVSGTANWAVGSLPWGRLIKQAVSYTDIASLSHAASLGSVDSSGAFSPAHGYGTAIDPGSTDIPSYLRAVEALSGLRVTQRNAKWENAIMRARLRDFMNEQYKAKKLLKESESPVGVDPLK